MASSGFGPAARRVLERLLPAEGFAKRDGMWVRHQEEQIHVLELQTHGLDFTFNVGFHYDFLPSFGRAWPWEERLKRSWDQLRITEYLMTTRLSRFEQDYRYAYRERWWPADGDAKTSAELVTQKVSFALEVFESLQRKYADPNVFLWLLTPEVLLSEVRVPEEAGEEGASLSNYVLYPFFPGTLSLCELCRILSERAGDAELATEYERVQKSLDARYRKRGWL